MLCERGQSPLQDGQKLSRGVRGEVKRLHAGGDWRRTRGESVGISNADEANMLSVGVNHSEE